ncbi:RnfABCDGE type electron transport complex subunit B [Candidatus Spongiihabitans sp.]|uniref:RnfABCDGE type electron transport complex subunit B n=1 Tax=Candidatus Spongiihabitans sp. TaxID=3101308 RepID=UPI003C7BE9C5
MTLSAVASLIDNIDRCLPQTQCTLCDYPRCREYAEAIAHGQAEINQCPPGGQVTINALSELLDKPALALNEEHGINEPKQIAYIDEPGCIGCKLCIKACPVNCIVGSVKLMHTVIVDE